MNERQKKDLKTILISTVFLVCLLIIPNDRFISLFSLFSIQYDNAYIYGMLFRFVLFFLLYLYLGKDVLGKALKGIKKHQVLDENFLMAVATIGALSLGEFSEAVSVMLFYKTGELFEQIAVGKSRENISALMDIRPEYANIEDAFGNLSTVDPDEIDIGTEIVIKPGEKVPIDGIVVSGDSFIDTASLTGESRKKSIKPGEEILSGCINLSSVIKVKTTKEFEESTASKILELVENASSRKSRSEAFISKFAAIYTPCVCIGAVLLAFVPPIINILMGNTAQFGEWIHRALTFLVISCPCALVISIPLTFFAGLGGAGNAGILIKGSNYLEALSKAEILAFDKTGTITEGVFEVTDIECLYQDEDILNLAAHAECYSTHPIAKSLIKAYSGIGAVIDRNIVSFVKETSGKGIEATVSGNVIHVGNDSFMKDINADAFSGYEKDISDFLYKTCGVVKGSQLDIGDKKDISDFLHKAETITGTVVHVAKDKKYLGFIVISDKIKPNSKTAVSKLSELEIKKTVMLTGDNPKTAAFVCRETGITDYKAGLLPVDKITEVENLMKTLTKGKTLAFAGDGINDAPVLMRADVGIAMGALGSDAAIEAADVVLMDDDPLKIAKALKISKKCMRIVYENIVFAIGIKLACLILGALGITGMWAAVFADVGVMVIAVLNAIRALRV